MVGLAEGMHYLDPNSVGKDKFECRREEGQIRGGDCGTNEGAIEVEPSGEGDAWRRNGM